MFSFNDKSNRQNGFPVTTRNDPPFYLDQTVNMGNGHMMDEDGPVAME